MAVADIKQFRQKTWGIYVYTRHSYNSDLSYYSYDLAGSTTSWEELKRLVKTQFANGSKSTDITVAEIIPWDYILTP